MDRTERFYKIDHLIRERGIEWDRDAGGYRFVKPDSAAPVYELPGLWFSPRESMSSPWRRGSNLLESLERAGD